MEAALDIWHRRPALPPLPRDQDELFTEAVSNMTAELIAPGGEYDPLDPANFGEAIAESLCCPVNGIAPALVKLIATGNHAGLALALQFTAAEYMRERAEDKAKHVLAARKDEH